MGCAFCDVAVRRMESEGRPQDLDSFRCSKGHWWEYRETHFRQDNQEFNVVYQEKGNPTPDIVSFSISVEAIFGEEES